MAALVAYLSNATDRSIFAKSAHRTYATNHVARSAADASCHDLRHKSHCGVAEEDTARGVAPEHIGTSPDSCDIGIRRRDKTSRAGTEFVSCAKMLARRAGRVKCSARRARRNEPCCRPGVLVHENGSEVHDRLVVPFPPVFHPPRASSCEKCRQQRGLRRGGSPLRGRRRARAAVREMASSEKLAVGQRLRVRPKFGPPQEGVVYTHDEVTNTVTIKQDIPNDSAHGTMIVYNRSHVEIDILAAASATIDESITLPNVR